MKSFKDSDGRIKKDLESKESRHIEGVAAEITACDMEKPDVVFWSSSVCFFLYLVSGNLKEWYEKRNSWETSSETSSVLL